MDRPSLLDYVAFELIFMIKYPSFESKKFGSQITKKKVPFTKGSGLTN